jgi:hypothetical protein
MLSVHEARCNVRHVCYLLLNPEQGSELNYENKKSNFRLLCLAIIQLAFKYSPESTGNEMNKALCSCSGQKHNKVHIRVTAVVVKIMSISILEEHIASTLDIEDESSVFLRKVGA